MKITFAAGICMVVELIEQKSWIFSYIKIILKIFIKIQTD